ncbi:MAG: DUF3108 domain-containing protein, partial [Gammaproteobacteria bacterium]|nr:DUF3108 domain-containing protein [Gammaproteobacteria bacterium]
SIASLLLLILLLISPGSSAEVPLRSFNASYDLYQGGMHIATAELSLQDSDGLWRWRMSTRSRGIYSLFINSSPYSETTFTQDNNDIQLQRILVTDAADEKKNESANFDWSKGTIAVLRRGKQKQLPLDANVYDYHSVHLLTAAMQLRQQENTTVDFYVKGKLVKSRIVYGGTGKVNINGESIDAVIYKQMIVRSNSRIKYYYDAANPLLPLRIEKLESGESQSVLSLQKVDWDL